MPFERFIKVFRLGKEEVQLLIDELADFNDNVGDRRDKIPFYMKVSDKKEFLAYCQARNAIERAFGSLKQRFKCLMKTRVLYYKHAIAAQIAYSCVILHNTCRLRSLPEIEEEEEEENDEDDEEMPIVDNYINILMEGRLVRQQLVALVAQRIYNNFLLF
jgi:hypothetical protein